MSEASIGLAPGAGDNGFAQMLATLLRQNIDERPEKKTSFVKMHGRVSIVLEDIGSAVTLHFESGRLTIHDGIVGIPDVTVRAPWEWVTKMSLVELEPRFGLPDVRKPIAKEVGEAQKNGTIKIHGWLASMPLMMRLTKVMSLRNAELTKLGFVHGFSTRTGGVSDAPFDSLNLGRAIGDGAGSVAINHRLFAEDVGYESLFELSQVHSAMVREVGPGEDPKLVRGEDGDALIARHPSVAVGVRTADCIPLLLAHPKSGAVAAVHAGWRGIAAATVEALDVPPSELIAVSGPHIRVASFEVGEEVAERLQAASSAKDVISRAYSRPHVDLFRVLEAQLADVGISLEDTGGDTFADAGRFFSYRRDGKTGRHLSVIVARGAA